MLFRSVAHGRPLPPEAEEPQKLAKTIADMKLKYVEKIEFGAPSTQWWSQLATAIAGGLAFATVLTLVLTPCLLMLGRDKKPEK